MTYYNDGKFMLRCFDKKERNPRIVRKDDYCLNDVIGLDNQCMPINGFNDPFCVCSFISDDLIAVSLYYAPTHDHYHLIINNKRRDLVGEIQKYRIPDSNK